MLTYTDSKNKAQRLAKTNNPDDLTQLSQDMNTGYHLFNQKLARYYSRKQQFTNLVAGQDIYQTPVDLVRVMGVTVAVNSNYEPTIKEVRDEYEWRQMKSYKTFKTNWPSHYYVLGKDALQLYPTPSQSFTNGLRFYYQPQDHDLSIDDTVSTGSNTVTVTNGSATVTAAGAAFNADMIGLQFQVTGQQDLTWYEITGATSTVLTLKSAYIGATASGKAWRIGQSWIIPQEYHDAPIHYALGNFFSAGGNEERAQYHLGSIDKPGLFYQMMDDCKQSYSSSTLSSVVSDDDYRINIWAAPPNPA